MSFGTWRAKLLPMPKAPAKVEAAIESEGEGKNFVNASRASLSFDLAIG
jgi:hypothetical protein